MSIITEAEKSVRIVFSTMDVNLSSIEFKLIMFDNALIKKKIVSHFVMLFQVQEQKVTVYFERTGKHA